MKKLEKYYLSLYFEYIALGQFFYRSFPGRTSCYVDVAPVASEPVNPSSMKYSGLDFTEDLLSIRLSWEPPNATFGEVKSYRVILLTKPLLPTDEISEIDEVASLYVSMNVSLSTFTLHFSGFQWKTTPPLNHDHL